MELSLPFSLTPSFLLFSPSLTSPSSLDALVFGYLEVILQCPLPATNTLHTHLLSCPNLLQLCNRVRALAFPDKKLSESEITTPTSSNGHPPSLPPSLPSPSSLKDHSPRFLLHQSPPPCGVIQRCGCQWVWPLLFWHCRQAGWGSSHPLPGGADGSQPWPRQRTDPHHIITDPECVIIVYM